MELLVALYTEPLGFRPDLIGWWMLWFLRVALPGLPLLCLTAHVLHRRYLRSLERRRARDWATFEALFGPR